MDKTSGEALREKLFYEPKNGFERISPDEESAAFSYCIEYKNFLNKGKTERECVDYAVDLLEKNGFKPFTFGATYKPGDKVYYNNRSCSIIFAIIGAIPMSQGVNIAAVQKEWFTWGDAYQIDVSDVIDPVLALSVVLVIDACIEAERD
jgi:hypothetical protein